MQSTYSVLLPSSKPFSYNCVFCYVDDFFSLAVHISALFNPWVCLVHSYLQKCCSCPNARMYSRISLSVFPLLDIDLLLLILSFFCSLTSSIQYFYSNLVACCF